MSQSYFQQFVPKKKNSVIKEEFKQAKKKAKKEKAAAINKRFEEKRRLKAEARLLSDQKDKRPIPKSVDKKEGKIQQIESQFKATQQIKAAVPPATPVSKSPVHSPKMVPSGDSMPLNKYLAHCGVCSRRDAILLIKEGKVKVNDQVILEPAFKVSDREEVKFNGKKIFVTKNLVYILLNKPKDYITTTDDPQGRKTVLQLTKMATTERIYPVGRLDRNTSGVLLLTNDGELTQKLSHPSYNITKVYEAKLDKPLLKADFEQILAGVTLEDGLIQADSLAYADSKDKSIIGIEIHSGRNRIVRRIFEHLGYDVKGLDRVMYANLTKKNVERGKWRFLSEKEVRLLKYMNNSYKKAAEKTVAPTSETAQPARTAKPSSEKKIHAGKPAATEKKTVTSKPASAKKTASPAQKVRPSVPKK